jgi:hypothetical protein
MRSRVKSRSVHRVCGRTTSRACPRTCGRMWLCQSSHIRGRTTSSAAASGFGIYIGFPVPYPLMFGPPMYVYGDGVISEPSQYGGVSLDIRPDTASVWVDSVYVGLARDFSPTHQPLTLVPGFHHIELQAPGMVPLAFNVDIVVGEVQPFSGMLQPE